jgi:hypothetical protein
MEITAAARLPCRFLRRYGKHPGPEKTEPVFACLLKLALGSTPGTMIQMPRERRAVAEREGRWSPLSNRNNQSGQEVR